MRPVAATGVQILRGLYLAGFWPSAALLFLWSIWAVFSLAYIMAEIHIWIVLNVAYPFVGWFLLWRADKLQDRGETRHALALAWLPLALGACLALALWGVPGLL